MQKRQGRPLFGITLTSAVVLIAVLGMLSSKREPGIVPAPIAVEHEGSLSLTLTASSGREKGILELSHDGAAVVTVIVPEHWEMREVRGGSIDTVRNDKPALGLRRWHLPPNVTISLWTTGGGNISVRNVSTTPLLVKAKRADLEKNSVDERTVLVKDETTLW